MKSKGDTCDVGQCFEIRKISADINTILFQAAANFQMEFLVGRQIEGRCHIGPQVKMSHGRIRFDSCELIRVGFRENDPESDGTRQSPDYDEKQRWC